MAYRDFAGIKPNDPVMFTDLDDSHEMTSARLNALTAVPAGTFSATPVAGFDPNKIMACYISGKAIERRVRGESLSEKPLRGTIDGLINKHGIRIGSYINDERYLLLIVLP